MSGWSEEQYAAHMANLKRPAGEPAPAKRHKYGVAPKDERTVGLLAFASKAEAHAYQTLLLLLSTGEITELELQPRFLLQGAFADSTGKSHRASYYLADFQFRRGGKRVVVDVKGMKTPVYRLKIKLFLAQYPDITFEEWT